MGITESRAAEIVEEVFADQDVILGYRASVPYVHVKVWFNKYMEQTHLLKDLEKKIHRFVVSKDGESPLQFFADSLPPQNSIFILDRFSRGKLAARLSECPDEKVNRLKLLSE